MRDIIQKFLRGEKILYESGEEILFEMLKGQPLIISYATQRRRDELTETIKAHSLRSCILKEPHFYLSPEKLKYKLAAAKIPAEEIPFLLKILLWHDETKTGDREEISLEREEYGLFDLLADHEGTDVFWRKALEASQTCDIVLIHQYALAKKIAAEGKNGLIICEAARLEDSLTNSLRKKYTEARLRPIFGEKATLLFGFLGIFYERFSALDDIGQRGNVILDDAVRQSVEWKRVTDAIENLPIHPKKVELKTDFAPGENTIQWVTNYANEIIYSSAPLLLAEIFRESIAAFPNVLLVSEALSGDGSFRLMKELFELDSSWQEARDSKSQIQNSKFQIKIPEDFPEPYSEGYFKRCIKLFLELINEKRGKCLFLLSSKKTVDAMYQTLLPKMPNGTRLLGVGYSGGVGKSVSLFRENPEQTILLATNQILPHLPEIEDFIEIIVFQKIPFDPPFDPLIHARNKLFRDGFKEYTLPRAVMKFRELLGELRASAKKQPKICYLLDSRLKNRDYGMLFI